MYLLHSVDSTNSTTISILDISKIDYYPDQRLKKYALGFVTCKTQTHEICYNEIHVREVVGEIFRARLLFLV